LPQWRREWAYVLPNTSHLCNGWNRLLLDAARELSVPLPVASLVRDQMLAAIAAGNAELDWASLTDTAVRNAGLTLNRDRR